MKDPEGADYIYGCNSPNDDPEPDENESTSEGPDERELSDAGKTLTSFAMLGSMYRDEHPDDPCLDTVPF